MSERAIDLAELSMVAVWMRQVGAVSLSYGHLVLELGPVPQHPSSEVRPAPEPLSAEQARQAKAAALRALALGLK
jgi:hypothetical protein